jgi:hypothetical protein
LSSKWWRIREYIQAAAAPEAVTTPTWNHEVGGRNADAEGSPPVDVTVVVIFLYFSSEMPGPNLANARVPVDLLGIAVL